MSKHERQTFEPEDPRVEVFWEISTKQLNRLVKGLRSYNNFRQILTSPSGQPLAFDFVAFYKETCEETNFYLFVEEAEKKGKFLLTACRGVTPVINDILGPNLPSPSVL